MKKGHAGVNTTKKTKKSLSTLNAQEHSRSVKNSKQVFKDLKLFATDVDGVLTDAGMYYGESGEELKKFNTRDGMGIKLLQAKGVVTALITMENTKIVERRARKLGIPEIFQGVKDKMAILLDLSSKYGIACREMAYMGDDVNDIPALRTVGYAAAPADCVEQVRNVVNYVCKKKGGEGAVREVIDKILAAKEAK